MWPTVGTSNSIHRTFFVLDLVEKLSSMEANLDRLRSRMWFKVGIGVHEFAKITRESENFGVHEVKGKVRISFLLK